MESLESRIGSRILNGVKKNNFKITVFADKIFLKNKFVPVDVRIGYNPQKDKIITSISGYLPIIGLEIEAREENSEARFIYNKSENAHILSISSLDPKNAGYYAYEVSKQYSPNCISEIEKKVCMKKSPEKELSNDIIEFISSKGYSIDTSFEKFILYNLHSKIHVSKLSEGDFRYEAGISISKVPANGIGIEVKEKFSKIHLGNEGYDKTAQKHMFSISASKIQIAEEYMLKFSEYYACANVNSIL
jgi:hypothetical protein